MVVDIDPVYSLAEPSPDELAVNDELRAAPWYHVVMEDDNGLPIHTYLAEAQLSSEMREEHPSNRQWMNSHGLFVNNFRRLACATSPFEKPGRKNHLPGFFLFRQSQSWDFNCRATVHHDIHSRFSRQHCSLLVNHAQL